MKQKDLSKEQIILIKNYQWLKDNKEICIKIGIDITKQNICVIKHIKEKLKFINEDLVNFIIINKDNMTSGEIERHFNINVTGVVSLVYKMYDIKNFKNKYNSNVEKEELFLKYYNTMGGNFLIENYGFTKYQLRNYAKRFDIVSNRTYTNEQIKDITNLFLKNIPVYKIAKIYNKTPHAIESLLSRNGLYDDKNISSKYYVTAPELYLIDYLSEKLDIVLPDKTLKENRKYYYNVVGRYEIDIPIYIKDYKFAIEYDGEYWHKDNKNSDNKKDTVLKNHGYIIFRISSLDHDNDYYNLHKMDYKIDEIIKKIKTIIGSL